MLGTKVNNHSHFHSFTHYLGHNLLRLIRDRHTNCRAQILKQANIQTSKVANKQYTKESDSNQWTNASSQHFIFTGLALVAIQT